MQRRVIIVCIILFYLHSMAIPGHCLFGVADIVYDPTNGVQLIVTATNSIRTAANTYQEVQNSYQLIKGQIQQLQNDATNLIRSPFSIANEVLSLGQQITRVLNVQQTVSFESQQALQTFTTYYPRVQQQLTASDAMAMRQTWVDHQRKALETSVVTQGVLTSMTELIAQACRLLNSTQTARGALEIGQIQAMQQGLQHSMTLQQTQVTAAAERQKTLKEAESLALTEAGMFAHEQAHKPFATEYQPQGRLVDFTRP